MSEIKAANTTNVVGYFNPQKYPILIEISAINLKTDLAPNAYIRDRQGKYINDPIFEPYCHQKGLARSTSKELLPINFVPRFVKSERQPNTAAVSQATGFVRQPDGRTVPTFAATPQPQREVAANRKPYTGMTVEAARKAGLIGKPRIVSEDYGATETSGAPQGPIPDIKYSTESPPRVRTSAPLQPELTESDEKLTPEEQASRAQLQAKLNAAATSPEVFDPTTVRPNLDSVSVPSADELEEEEEPQPPPPTIPVPPKPKSTAPAPVPKPPAQRPPAPVQPQRIVPKRRIAAPIEPEPEPEYQTEDIQEVEPGSGIVQPLDESPSTQVMPSSPEETETGKRFICAADGRGFKFRSELERHVKRHYPAMLAELMEPYPP